ncbi:MAG: DUF952 domain-containing protein [Anaerolineae bacterium]|nr:DUF952 domain-containing protein [Anaerolineae bacterium]
MSERLIYHCTTPQAWEEARRSGQYVHPSLQEEGFIHLSQADQLSGVVARYYADRDDMILLVLDADEAAQALDLRWEATKKPKPDGTPDVYPHIYGAIPAALVRRTLLLVRRKDGSIVLDG